MKISLDNNLEFLYQWDIDRKVIITGAALDQEVHFATKDLDEALVIKPKEENGSLTCNIPNILLQDTKDIIVYLYDGNKTFFSKSFKVIARKKPADYIYKETEIFSYEKLAKELREMIATRANGIGYSDSKLSLYSDGKEIASTNIVTDDYRPLQYKPSINDVVLEGNKDLKELGIQPAGEYLVDKDYVHTDNNYTNEEKEKLASLENYNDTGIRDIVNEINNSKQDNLVSGENIKTINNESILGSGNFELPQSPITVVNESEYTFEKDGLYYFTKECKGKISNGTYTIPSYSIMIYAKREDCDIYLKIAPPRKFDDDPAIATFEYNVADRKGNVKTASLLSMAEGINLYFTAITDAVTAETNKIVTTGNVDEETGLTALNTSGIGKGLKLENQELSVNTEGLDISKATVEDTQAGINKTELISLIKDNLQIKTVSTGLKFENGVLSLDIENGDNLKYGTSK